MNSEALMMAFVAINALTSTGTLLGILHIWRTSLSNKEIQKKEEDLLEKNLNTRLRDLQMTRFSLRFPNQNQHEDGRK